MPNIICAINIAPVCTNVNGYLKILWQGCRFCVTVQQAVWTVTALHIKMVFFVSLLPKKKSDAFPGAAHISG